MYTWVLGQRPSRSLPVDNMVPGHHVRAIPRVKAGKRHMDSQRVEQSTADRRWFTPFSSGQEPAGEHSPRCPYSSLFAAGKTRRTGIAEVYFDTWSSGDGERGLNVTAARMSMGKKFASWWLIDLP